MEERELQNKFAASLKQTNIVFEQINIVRYTFFLLLSCCIMSSSSFDDSLLLVLHAARLPIQHITHMYAFFDKSWYVKAVQVRKMWIEFGERETTFVSEHFCHGIHMTVSGKRRKKKMKRKFPSLSAHTPKGKRDDDMWVFRFTNHSACKHFPFSILSLILLWAVEIAAEAAVGICLFGKYKAIGAIDEVEEQTVESLQTSSENDSKLRINCRKE